MHQNRVDILRASAVGPSGCRSMNAEPTKGRRNTGSNSSASAARENVSSGSVTHWIDLFRAVDEEASRRLWSRYFEPLIGVARAKLSRLPGNALDAEDIALSAFHGLYRAASANRLPEMNDRDGLWQSLLLITAGKVTDARRREFSQKRGGSQTVRTAIHLVDFLQSNEPDPSMSAMLADQFEFLLNRLEECELQEIALLKLEGFTNVEIAHRLHCSERTVKRRLMIVRRIWEESGVAPSQ